MRTLDYVDDALKDFLLQGVERALGYSVAREIPEGLSAVEAFALPTEVPLQWRLDGECGKIRHLFAQMVSIGIEELSDIPVLMRCGLCRGGIWGRARREAATETDRMKFGRSMLRYQFQHALRTEDREVEGVKIGEKVACKCHVSRGRDLVPALLFPSLPDAFPEFILIEQKFRRRRADTFARGKIVSSRHRIFAQP